MVSTYFLNFSFDNDNNKNINNNNNNEYTDDDTKEMCLITHVEINVGVISIVMTDIVQVTDSKCDRQSTIRASEEDKNT